jgi:uncharacterized protein YecA (UPF0149 family)
MGIFDYFYKKATRSSIAVGRNEPCWCGSNKKYKNCHLESDNRKRAAELAKQCKTG